MAATAASAIEMTVAKAGLTIEDSWLQRTDVEAGHGVFDEVVESLVAAFETRSDTARARSVGCALSCLLPWQSGYRDELDAVIGVLNEQDQYNEDVVKAIVHALTHGPFTGDSRAATPPETTRAFELEVEVTDSRRGFPVSSIGIPHKVGESDAFSLPSPRPVELQGECSTRATVNIYHLKKGTVQLHQKMAERLAISPGEPVSVRPIVATPAYSVTLAVPEQLQSTIDQFEKDSIRNALIGRPLPNDHPVTVRIVAMTEQVKEILETYTVWTNIRYELPLEAFGTLPLTVVSSMPADATMIAPNTQLQLTCQPISDQEQSHIEELNTQELRLVNSLQKTLRYF